jgi:glycerol-3-phosphate dehydrogenase
MTPVLPAVCLAPQNSQTLHCDVLVVGGGINGVGIARDLAGRGIKVVLCEKDDLASHTSSCSTKLIHGGLRYLEYYEFLMVRKSLIEREVLFKSAPHIMWPLRFIMPHDPSMRPLWLLRLGLFLYDHLAKREILPGSETIALRDHPAGQPLKPGFTKGLVYSDGWVDDARLVVLNAMAARQLGATVLTRTMCTKAERNASGWQAQLKANDGKYYEVQARALVNATGPWVEQFLREHAHQPGTKTLRLVKGSHIVVRKMFEHPMAYIFQNPDKRIIFVVPYEEKFTLIGTTDIEHQGSMDAVNIADDEIDYLCEQASRYFAKPVTPQDVVWSYSGVRPLLEDASDDPAAVTRDYLLELDTKAAPLLSVWGGKITTFRKLAEEAADLLCGPLKNHAPAWTAGKTLPGGDLSDYTPASGRPDEDFFRFEAVLAERFGWLPTSLRHRLARCYGGLVPQVLSGATRIEDLGEQIAENLYEAELHYLCKQEWATCAEDVLWRRTKLGLHLNSQEQAAVAMWFDRQKIK